jgi:predicted small metal-binding protein
MEEKVLRCDCGFEVHADDEAELVAGVRRHALAEHGMELSPEEVLQLAFRAELGEPTWRKRLADENREDAS